MSTKLILIVGVLIFVVSTVGFGADLNNNTSFNFIAADDNVSVPTPDAVITNVVLHESGISIDSATITVRNISKDTHSYNICVIAKANSSLSDKPGTSSDCTTTASISGDSTGSSVINFSNQIRTLNFDYADISVQQIT